MTADKIERLIRKLLRLARRSDKQHEADNAAARAAELMAKYGVSVRLDDEEAAGDRFATEVVDDRRDQLRTALAQSVAATRGCRAHANAAGWLAVRGERAAAANARELYRHIVEHGERACVASFWDIPPDLRDVQRLRFWLGYVVAVVERLAKLPAPAPPPAPTSPMAATGDGHTSPPPAPAHDVTREVPTPEATPPPPPTPPPAHDTLFRNAVREAARRMILGMPPGNAEGILNGIYHNAVKAGAAAAASVTITPWDRNAPAPTVPADDVTRAIAVRER